MTKEPPNYKEGIVYVFCHYQGHISLVFLALDIWLELVAEVRSILETRADSIVMLNFSSEVKPEFNSLDDWLDCYDINPLTQEAYESLTKRVEGQPSVYDQYHNNCWHPILHYKRR